MKKLKERWGITSNFQIIIILLVFSVTGSLSVALAKPLMNGIGVTKELMNPIIFWSIRVFSMFVIYQVLLVTIGTIMGQHKFFWGMEKKMLSRIGLKKFFKE
ncbi:MAG: DUF6787 family protein [Psychroserpens sp.]|uniref:DUF6787 family protein n=1 Tax=Psychroserpens sp. TaxID=2020870 RepID=UPI003002A28A